MPEIILPPQEQPRNAAYTSTCAQCRSTVRFRRLEAILIHDAYLAVDCPVCGAKVGCHPLHWDRPETMVRAGILPAQDIRQLCRTDQLHPPMIKPFCERSLSGGKSFGLSAAGYDVRIAEDIWLWPFWGRLASTVEEFALPADVVAFVHDKSSWARVFVFAGHSTVGEPGWRGFLTVEIVRLLPWPIKIRAGTPIAQMIFHRMGKPTSQPYRGKYQNQEAGPQPARDEGPLKNWNPKRWGWR